MRIVALDASKDDARTERASGVALARAPQRLFLFRAAAACASRLIARDMARRDERFFELATSWLLDSDPARTAPPTRASVSVPLMEVGIAVVVNAATAAPMPATTLALELLDTKVCMALPAFLDREEIGNASLWIVGGEDAFQLEESSSHVVVWPGDVIAAGGAIAVIDWSVACVRVSRVNIEGQVIDERTSSIPDTRVRMQVQG